MRRPGRFGPGRIGFTLWGTPKRLGLLPYLATVDELSPADHESAMINQGDTGRPGVAEQKLKGSRPGIRRPEYALLRTSRLACFRCACRLTSCGPVGCLASRGPGFDGEVSRGCPGDWACCLVKRSAQIRALRHSRGRRNPRPGQLSARSEHVSLTRPQ